MMLEQIEGDPSYSSHSLVLRIRKSLRGTARKIKTNLGDRASVMDILRKCDTLFGDVSNYGMIMQEFFNATQREDESITSFSCRLEGILQVAIENGYVDACAKISC